MAEADAQERTERPTGKRLSDARQRGQVPRSRELNTTVMLLAASGGLLFLGERMFAELRRIFSDGLRLERDAVMAPDAIGAHLLQAAIDIGWLLAPFFVLMLVAAFMGPIALGGWNFTGEALKFKPEKLNPIDGFKRLLSWRGVVELLKALAKFSVVATLAYLLLNYRMKEFLGLGYESLEASLAHAGHLLVWSFLALSATLILIAAVDVPFQLWDHTRQLKMTKKEVKDEAKDMEGSPEIKGRIRRLQYEQARRRMMQEVPKADVVVTNPTHFAVALRYDQDRMRAPRVVAKGTDLTAAQIRKVAAEHNVALFEAPPLARALYYSTDLDQEIPAALYLAVAQVLAYVYQLKTVRAGGGLEPEPPRDLSVPEELYKPYDARNGAPQAP